MPTRPWPECRRPCRGRRRRGRRRAPRAARLGRGRSRRRRRRCRACGVLEGVGEPLLHDAVRRQVERRAAAATGSPCTCSRTSRPAARTSSSERVEVVAARAAAAARAGPRRCRIAPSSRRISARAVRPACSTFRSASRSSASAARHPVPHRADLQHHHAHRVRDDVVQLTRDPRPLLGHGEPGRRLALPLGLRRALLGGLGLHRRARAARSRPASRSRTAAG